MRRVSKVLVVTLAIIIYNSKVKQSKKKSLSQHPLYEYKSNGILKATVIANNKMQMKLLKPVQLIA